MDSFLIWEKINFSQILSFEEIYGIHLRRHSEFHVTKDKLG